MLKLVERKSGRKSGRKKANLKTLLDKPQLKHSSNLYIFSLFNFIKKSLETILDKIVSFYYIGN